MPPSPIYDPLKGGDRGGDTYPHRARNWPRMNDLFLVVWLVHIIVKSFKSLNLCFN
jgi:hypothetical protein